MEFSDLSQSCSAEVAELLLLFVASSDINSLTRPSLSPAYFNEPLFANATKGHVRHSAYQQVTVNNAVEARAFKDTGNGIMVSTTADGCISCEFFLVKDAILSNVFI